MALRFVARSIVCAAALAVCGIAHAQTPPPVIGKAYIVADISSGQILALHLHVS